MKDEAKNRIIKKLVKRGMIDEGENTIKFIYDMPLVKLCKPLVIEDHCTGQFSYQQLANKYGLTFSQVRNIVSK